jgi:hypothetical protein
MPYKIKKQSCKRSDGKRGNYILSYTDKKGKKHSNCHFSKKKAQGQISAIEADIIKEIFLELYNQEDV